jgi:CheY-like chemotaxis protein
MTSPAKILLVDDDHDFVEATRIVLESAPYEVAVAYNGDEALRTVREVDPDLIILDIIMPEKHGFLADRRYDAGGGRLHRQTGDARGTAQESAEVSGGRSGIALQTVSCGSRPRG